MSDNEPLDAEIVDDPTPAPAPLAPGDYTDAGVPTFEYARDKIMGKVGAAELSQESPESLSIDQQLAERDRAGRDKLEEIRRSMRGE